MKFRISSQIHGVRPPCGTGSKSIGHPRLARNVIVKSTRSDSDWKTSINWAAGAIITQARKKVKPIKVDPSGEMASGETFAGVEDYKQILLTTRADTFTRHLISMVLTHATGRHMETLDQFVIDDIDARVTKDGGGLRTLVIESLTSEIFRSR